MTPYHDYLTKAGELMAKAEAEHAMIMRAMYESLARSYLRLAERDRAVAAAEWRAATSGDTANAAE